MHNSDPIREAFLKAKQDISELRVQLLDLSNQISELRTLFLSFSHQNSKFESKIPSQTDRQTNQQALGNQKPTELPIIIDTSNPQVLTELNNSSQFLKKSQDLSFSTGNKGVPTDRQTNQQTNRHLFFDGKSFSNSSQSNSQVRLIQVSEALESISLLKQNLRDIFKALTKQELLFFSTIYQLENEGFIVDYSLLSSKLNLSQSSIRDYALKIIRKGIPLIKTKKGNKKVLLSISPDLKKVASLDSILSF